MATWGQPKERASKTWVADVHIGMGGRSRGYYVWDSASCSIREGGDDEVVEIAVGSGVSFDKGGDSSR